MKNKMSDLNNHLFAELERLSDEDLKGDQLEAEISRASAICKVSQQVIDAGALALRAEKFKTEYTGKDAVMPALLEDKKA